MIKRGTELTDDSPPKCNVAAEVNIPGNSQMVQLDNLRNFLEPLLELRNLRGEKMPSGPEIRKPASLRTIENYLLEVITKFDYGSSLKHPLLVDNKLSVFQRVNVTLD